MKKYLRRLYYRIYLRCYDGFCSFHHKKIKRIRDCGICSVCNWTYKCVYYSFNYKEIKNTIKINALAHYDRMIAWANKRPINGSVQRYRMQLALKESWDAVSCVYCMKCDCSKCPLSVNLLGCCGGLYRKLGKSETWGEWVQNATDVRNFIEKNG